MSRVGQPAAEAQGYRASVLTLTAGDTLIAVAPADDRGAELASRAREAGINAAIVPIHLASIESTPVLHLRQWLVFAFRGDLSSKATAGAVRWLEERGCRVPSPA